MSEVRDELTEEELENVEEAKLRSKRRKTTYGAMLEDEGDEK